MACTHATQPEEVQVWPSGHFVPVPVQVPHPFVGAIAWLHGVVAASHAGAISSYVHCPFTQRAVLHSCAGHEASEAHPFATQLPA